MEMIIFQSCQPGLEGFKCQSWVLNSRNGFVHFLYIFSTASVFVTRRPFLFQELHPFPSLESLPFSHGVPC